MLTMLSLPQDSAAPYIEVPPEPPVPLVGKRTSLPQHLGLLCGRPYPNLAPWGLQGNLQDLTTGILTVMEKEERKLQQLAQGSWQTESIPPVTQVVIQPLALLICRTRWGAHSDLGTQGAVPPDLIP